MGATSIAVNRFGIGARAGEAPPADPRRWLTDQLARFDPAPPPIAAAAGTAAVATMFADYQREQRALRAMGGGQTPATAPAPAATPAAVPPAPAAPAKPGRSDAQREARRDTARALRGDYDAAVGARFAAALATDAPFVERLVWFWANHFAVSVDKLAVTGLAGAFEFEAIRPHVLGRFADLVSAAEHHPAMLLYLDQTVSTGPDSPLGRRAALRPGAKRKLGLNENLAREILELHTLGVRTGYTQADVTEFARALTGWTVEGIGGGPLGRVLEDYGTPGRFVFAEPMHESGTRTVLGRRYPDHGAAQAQAVLLDVAAAPATVHHLCTKLARHFIADQPPPAAVARLEAAWTGSGGDLPTVYRALVASPEAWAAGAPKFRTPWEWAVAAHRALGTRQVQGPAVAGLLGQLGQPVWKPGQPVGWDDTAASWAAPDALRRRVEAAERLAGRAGAADARGLADQLFPGAVSPATAEALARAESPGQALELLLVSPEMMRR